MRSHINRFLLYNYLQETIKVLTSNSHPFSLKRATKAVLVQGGHLCVACIVVVSHNLLCLEVFASFSGSLLTNHPEFWLFLNNPRNSFQPPGQLTTVSGERHCSTYRIRIFSLDHCNFSSTVTFFYVL